MYYIPEAIGAIFWLLMDFCWLSKELGLAYLFCIGAVTSLGIAASNTLFVKECKISERFNFSASWTWCIMNSFWMMSEWPSEDPGGQMSNHCLFVAKIMFIISSVLVLFSIIFSIIEKHNFSFGRLRLSNSSDETQKETVNDKFNKSLNNSNLKIKEDVKRNNN